jgi:Xaa-Pro aminopeptidase
MIFSSYPFRQNSNVIYLSGILDANVAILLHKTKSGSSRFVVFTEDENPEEQVWSGAKTNSKAAIEHFGADEAFSVRQIGKVLKATGVPSHSAFVEIDENSAHSLDGILRNELKENNTQSPNQSMQSIDIALQWMRVVKEEAEIEAMKSASELAAEAMRSVMQVNWNEKMESELAALFQFECVKRGAEMLAYTPVVASGKNALTLHYIHNKALMKEGELVLVDAGAYHNFYNTDVSRTFPVGNSFTEEQAELYEIVLQVQKKCISKCTESISLNELHEYSVQLMTEELQDIGIHVNEEVMD